MYRRPFGRGRLLAAGSSIAILIGCLPFLPWYTAGGQEGLPPFPISAFDGSGIVVFLVALATLALVTLPYAAGDRPVSVDRGLSYALLVVLGVAGFLVRVVEFVSRDPHGLRPDLAPGLWIAGVGLVGLARAAFEIGQERGR